MVHDPPIQQYPFWQLAITQSSIFISSYEFPLKNGYKCTYQLLILTVKANNCFSHLKGDIPLWQQKRFTWLQLEKRNCSSTIKYLHTCPSLGRHFRVLHPKKLLIAKGLGASLNFTVSLAQSDSLPVWHLPDVEISRVSKGFPVAATMWGRQQAWDPRQSPAWGTYCSKGEGSWEPHQGREQGNFYISYLAASSCLERFSSLMCFQPFYFCLSRRDADKRTPLEKTFENWKIYKEWEKSDNTKITLLGLFRT